MPEKVLVLENVVIAEFFCEKSRAAATKYFFGTSVMIWWSPALVDGD